MASDLFLYSSSFLMSPKNIVYINFKLLIQIYQFNMIICLESHTTIIKQSTLFSPQLVACFNINATTCASQLNNSDEKLHVNKNLFDAN